MEGLLSLTARWLQTRCNSNSEWFRPHQPYTEGGSSCRRLRGPFSHPLSVKMAGSAILCEWTLEWGSSKGGCSTSPIPQCFLLCKVVRVGWLCSQWDSLGLQFSPSLIPIAESLCDIRTHTLSLRSERYLVCLGTHYHPVGQLLSFAS